MQRTYWWLLVATTLITLLSLIYNIVYSSQGSNKEFQRYTSVVSTWSLDTPNNPVSTRTGTADNETELQTDHGQLQVLLLSYQRSGSSMMGNALFQHHRNASTFFWYEPLDALYSSLYGSEPGWNIPADITFSPNGSYRQLPVKESSSVEEYLRNVFQCRFSRLPPEALVHPFWFYFPNSTSSMYRYPECLKEQGITSASLFSCQLGLRRSCGKRFSEKRSKSEACQRRLVGFNSTTQIPADEALMKLARRPGWDQLIGRRSGVAASGTTILLRVGPYIDYRTCLRLLADRSLPCQRVLSNICKERPVTAVKTVRATMKSVRTLLRDLPNLKVIHLVRDPRGAILSRSKVAWSQGAYDTKNVEKMARVYCGTVMSDVETRNKLEIIFPGRLMQLVFDDFLDHPRETNRKISNFLSGSGSHFDGSKMAEWVDEHIKTSVKEKWMNALSEQDSAVILQTCKEYMAVIQRK